MKRKTIALTLPALLLIATTIASAQTVSWKGYTWKVGTGGIGGGVVTGNATNVTVDAHHALHLKLAKSADKWTGSELFTQTNLGFGTYQWVLQGTNFYNMDSPVVLGLFTYGPAHGIGVDGEGEIDTEFSNWNGTATPPGTRADFTSYPATGYKNRVSDAAAHENDFFLAAPAAETTTVRMTWSPTKVVWTIMAGTVPLSTTKNVIKADTFDGSKTTVPQAPCPVGINLWSFKSAPTHPLEIIIRDFQFVPQGQ